MEAVDYKLIENLEDCASHYEALDSDCVRVAVHINSGNRCPAYDRNLKIKIAADKGVPYKPGGKPSEHLRGWATDFWMEYVYEPPRPRAKIPDDDIADYLESRYIGRYGIGRYVGRTHHDTRTGPAARWDER